MTLDACKYDKLYRLTSVDNPSSADESYTYDDVGNRLTAAGAPWTHNANNELLGYDTTTYDYDDNGNLTQKTVNTTDTNYIYDIQNRLVRIEDYLNNTIAEYYYDPFGRRLWKDVGGTRTYYFYSEEGLIGEYESDGTEIKTYGYEPDSTWGTNPLFQKVGDTYYWYLNDRLGTPQKIIDTSGSTVWSVKYSSFGDSQIVISEIDNNLRFPGQLYNDETGLHYNYFRDYNPVLGRYIETDPKGFEGGINLYGYVDNNPINFTDSYGLAKDCCCDGVPTGAACRAYSKCGGSGYILWFFCTSFSNSCENNCKRLCLALDWNNCNYDHGLIGSHVTCFSICGKSC